MCHEPVEDVVYWGMDWECPGFHKVLREKIVENYGQINAEIALRKLIAGTNSGNLHVAVYDFENDHMYVSFTKSDDSFDGSSNAYKRSYTRLDMADNFSKGENVKPTDAPHSESKLRYPRS